MAEVDGMAVDRMSGRRRRGAREGSIYCRGDGRWVSYLRLADGRKKFFTGASRREVQARLQVAQNAQAEGRLSIGRDRTLAQFLPRWLDDVVRHSVRASTELDYELNIRRLLPLIGQVRLRSLTPEQIQRAYGTLLGRGLSARTVHQTHMVLRRALKQAVLWCLLDRNPTDAVRPPRPERKEMKVLDREQVVRLLAGTMDSREHALWTLLVTTGLREGEALGLRWSDLDLELGLQAHLKSHEDLDEVQIAASTFTKLHRALEQLGLPAWQPTDMPRIRVHDLRHTAATHLLVRGVHPKVVQDLLGHSTIAITLDTYSHVMPSLARDATEYMEDFFEPAVSRYT